MKEVFGEETIERTGPVWGLDHEGELRGCYRPSGHPGVGFPLFICFATLKSSPSALVRNGGFLSLSALVKAIGLFILR